MDYTTNNSLLNFTTIMHRHVDSDGNTVCEQISNELKQVIDRNILLEQVPHPKLGIDVLYHKKNIIDGSEIIVKLKEVDIKNSLKEGEFKVDYISGRIFLHHSIEGLFLNINYWGVGYNLIHSGRVYTKIDEHGNIIETLEDLIDIILKMGDTQYIIDVLRDIEKCKISIVNDINYESVHLRLENIEQRVNEYLEDYILLSRKVTVVENDMQSVRDIAVDVEERMQILENNYLNPSLISSAEIDEILGKLV